MRKDWINKRWRNKRKDSPGHLWSVRCNEMTSFRWQWDTVLYSWEQQKWKSLIWSAGEGAICWACQTLLGGYLQRCSHFGKSLGAILEIWTLQWPSNSTPNICPKEALTHHTRRQAQEYSSLHCSIFKNSFIAKCNTQKSETPM